MQIISFKIDGKYHRYFLSEDLKLPNKIDLSNSTVSLNGKTASFFVKDGALYKFIKSKRHRNKRRLLSENVDKIFGMTPASKEARGNRFKERDHFLPRQKEFEVWGSTMPAETKKNVNNRNGLLFSVDTRWSFEC